MNLHKKRGAVVNEPENIYDLTSYHLSWRGYGHCSLEPKDWEKDQRYKKLRRGIFSWKPSMGGFVLAMAIITTYTSASSFVGGPELPIKWGLAGFFWL